MPKIPEDTDTASGYAWDVYLSDGGSFRDGQSGHGHVRAVRTGQ